jgi:hypothetical protein
MFASGLFNINAIGRKLVWAKPGLVVLGWTVSIASLALTGILRGVIIPHSAQYVPQAGVGILGVALYYGGIFGLSILAGWLLADTSKAVLGFFVSYGVGMFLTFLALAMPGFAGVIPGSIAELSAVVFAFTALFPLAFLAGLVGALLGAASSEV